MGHFLSTVNPEAAAKLEPALPHIGETVRYFPRPGELRAGGPCAAAIVTRVWDEDRTVDLVIIYDADDAIGQRRVPARTLDAGMGWERLPQPSTDLVPEMMRRIEAMVEEVRQIKESLFGAHKALEGESVYGILAEHEERLEAAEKSTRAAPTRTKNKTKPRNAPQE